MKNRILLSLFLVSVFTSASLIVKAESIPVVPESEITVAEKNKEKNCQSQRNTNISIRIQETGENFAGLTKLMEEKKESIQKKATELGIDELTVLNQNTNIRSNDRYSRQAKDDQYVLEATIAYMVKPENKAIEFAGALDAMDFKVNYSESVNNRCR